MDKFQWTLLKTLEYVNSRRPDLEIRANFLQQLQAYTKRRKTPQNEKMPRTEEWSETLITLEENKSSLNDP